MSAYVISREYGKCLEGWQAARHQLEQALAACAYNGRDSDRDALVRERGEDVAAWEDLLRVTPRFVESGA